jgi:hypothetical protein
MYYQNRDSSIPQQLWVGADAYFITLVQTKPGYVRFWNEMETAFDDPSDPTPLKSSDEEQHCQPASRKEILFSQYR